MMKTFIATFIYFFLAFCLVGLTEVSMKRDYALHFNFVLVSVSALIMAKAVLLSDHLHWTRCFSHKPLMYVVLWKTIVYSVVSFLLRVVEHVGHMLYEGHSLNTIFAATQDRMGVLPVWIVQMWLTVLLFAFVAYRELILEVGPRKVYKLFFKK